MILDDNDLIKKGERLPEYEGVISEDPCYSYCYARNVIRGRWSEGEKAILKNPYYSYYYALFVIKGRWLEAEPIIKEDRFWWGAYCRDLGR